MTTAPTSARSRQPRQPVNTRGAHRSGAMAASLGSGLVAHQRVHIRTAGLEAEGVLEAPADGGYEVAYQTATGANRLGIFYDSELDPIDGDAR
jgi:hypothetical protein